MKKSTSFVASALLLASATVNAQAIVKHPRLKLMAAVATAKAVQKAPAKAKAQATVMPKVVKEYLYNMEDKVWEEGSVYEYTYDSKGNILSQKETYDGEVNLTTNGWNEMGQNTLRIQQTSQDGGVTFVNASKRVQQFDPIADNLVVYKMNYLWQDDDWKESGDGFQRVITRDADNNIIGLELQTPYEGKMDAMQRYTNIVDPNTKQITEYKFEELTYDGVVFAWQTSEFLRNLKWKETNGQIYTQYDEWMNTGNKLLSASLSYEENGEIEDFGTITVDYKDDGKSFEEVAQYLDMPERVVSTMDYVDNNGSLVYTMKCYFDNNADGIYGADDLMDWQKQTVTYNDHGDCILEQVEGLDDDGSALEIWEATQNDYIYDADNGDAMKEYLVSSYDYDEGTFVPMMKFVTESFVDITAGINDISASATDNAAKVYNMQGIRTNGNSAANGKGLFIVKRGNKTYKVVK